MTTCIEVLEIKDIILEGKSGNIRAVAGLPKSQTTGLLAGIKKKTDQADDVVSEKGLGSYGLTLEKLQIAGIVKTGITEGVDLETTLSDSSVFTGKKGISNVNVLLRSNALQKQVMQDVISKNMTSLQQEGVLTGDETEVELAGFAALAANYSVDEIKDFVNGTASPDLAAEMAGVQDDAESVATLIQTKASSIMDTISGIGGGAAAAVESATNTIKLDDINKALDDFIGSKRVPSAVTGAIEEATKAAGSLSKGDLF